MGLSQLSNTSLIFKNNTKKQTKNPIVNQLKN